MMDRETWDAFADPDWLETLTEDERARLESWRRYFKVPR